MEKNFWSLYSSFFDAFPQCVIALKANEICYENSAAKSRIELNADFLAELFKQALPEGSSQPKFGSFDTSAGQYTAFFSPIEDTTGIILTRSSFPTLLERRPLLWPQLEASSGFLFR
jgi:hypothetical protein